MLDNRYSPSFIRNEIVYKVIDQLNELLPNDKRLSKSPSTILMGKESTLDSLHLVNLLVNVEVMIEDRLDTTINLSGNETIYQENGFLQNVESLTDFIINCLDKT